MNVVTVAYLGEGPTDERFLGKIIERTLYDIIAKSYTDLQVYVPYFAGKSSLKNLKYQLTDILGFTVICIHADADNATPKRALEERVQPLVELILEHRPEQKTVPIVPVYMVEAWMLADSAALKEELSTDRSYQELGIKIPVESITDPKKALQGAIHIIDQALPPKQRGQNTLGSLYEELSNNIDLHELKKLPSYQAFYKALENSLKTLHFIH